MVGWWTRGNLQARTMALALRRASSMGDRQSAAVMDFKYIKQQVSSYRARLNGILLNQGLVK